MQRLWSAVISCSFAAVSHESAGQLWGLDWLFRSHGEGEKNGVSITVSPRTAGERVGVVVHQSIQVEDPLYVCRHETGLMVTTPERTLIDLSGDLGPGGLMSAFDGLCNKGLTTPERIKKCLDHMSVQGLRRITIVREFLAYRMGDPVRVESNLERKVLTGLRSTGLSDLVTQREIITPDGTFRMDIALERARIDVEVDGPHHMDATQIVHDRRRDSAISSCGWLVMRFVTYDDLNTFVWRVRRMYLQRTSLSPDSAD